MSDRSRRLAGRYDLQGVIGRGGMGTVYAATDLVLDRSVAVKVLPALLAADGSRVLRFEREARAAASLAHDGVVAVYDTGADDATRFIVMELVSGRSLAEVLREQAPLAPARAAGIAAGVAGALGAAHAAQIVHRDVKPGNVMLTDDGRVKVLDFGIARALDATALTHGTAVLGTAGYVAPEQARGERADGRSDVYALGCLLYAMLTGRPPFTGELAAVLAQHVSSAPPHPSSLNSAIPAQLDALVMQMLEKDPAARPQDADELARRLLAAASAPAGAATLPLPRRRPRPALPGAGANRRLRTAAAAALGCALLAAILLIALGSSGGPPPRSAATARTRGGSASRTPQRSHAAASARTPATTPSRAGPGPAGPATAPPAVAASAAALASLLARAAQEGALDPASARAMTQTLQQLLGAYERSRPLAAQRRRLELTGILAAARERGGLGPAAATAIDGAIATLGAALSGAGPPAAPAAPDGRPGPGDQETPGKVHGHGHEHGGKGG